MRRSTIIGFFVGLLSLTLSAQSTQPSSSKTTGVEIQKKSTASIQDLLVRYANVGNQMGSISEHFTTEEQQMLRSYFRDKQAGKQTNVVQRKGASNAAEALNKQGVNSPIYYNQQQKKQVGALTESQRAADVDMKNLGKNNPTYTNARDKGTTRTAIRPLERSLFGTYNFSTSGAGGGVISNPAAGTVSLQGTGNRIMAPVVITQSVSQSILAGNSVTCNTGGIPDQNSFFRAFDLEANYGITGVFNVTNAEFAVELSSGPTSLTINIYSTSATFPTGYPGNATLQGTANYVSNASDSGTVVSVPITASIPAGDIMIYELKINAGATTSWFPGSNASGQTGPSYIMSAACAITTPTNTAAIGFPNMHLVMNVVGEEGGGGGPFPFPYCGPLLFSSNVEPITLVEVAGISNVTSATVGGTPAHEDFTAIEGDMEAGMSYPIAMEGNTDGGFTNRFVVFVDWNQNGVLNDAGEVYEMTDLLVGSTGTDGQQVNGDIAVPSDALAGSTRMRVKKIFGTTNFLDPCLGAGFGQAEDYTINVTAGGGGGDEWTVTVEDAANFGDEVSWELRDNIGTVILSGGPYGAPPYTDTQMVTTDNEPLEFFIESQGTFGDNTPMYTVSCSGNVIITGTIAGGSSNTFSDLVCGGGGTGGPCATTGPSNGFENGKSFTKNLGRVAANDLTVVDGEDMLLETITFTAFIGATGSGVNAANVDVFIYEDNGSGAPGALLTSQPSVIPASQVVVGNNFGFEAWSVELDIADVNLPGQTGSATTYWIGLSLEPTDGSNTFWENSTAGLIGFGEAYDDGLGGGFIVDSTLEGVYSFDGTCSPIGGTGGPCATTGPSNGFENGKSFTKNLGRVAANDLTVIDGEDMLLETITFTAFIGATGSGVNAANVDVFIYADNGSGAPGALLTSQPSVIPASQVVVGTNFGFEAWSVELDIADVNLPGQNGSATTYWIGLSLEPTDGSNTFWENSTAGLIGFGEAYDDGLGGGFVVDSTLEGVYSFDGTCSPIGGGTGGVLDTAYGVNNGNFELIGFPVSDPSTVEVFGDSPITVNFENAGAIDPANPRTGYVIDNGGQFYSFSVESGIYTLLGNIPGDWVGMEFDQATGILYAIAGTSLYTLDPIGVSATLVGSLGLTGLPIALAIDGAGVGYTYDLVDDNLYSINMATGATTLIGNIGFDANFGQGMCYDALTDTVYMAAFNSGTFAAEWRSVNTSTGATTLIGPIVTTAVTTQVAWVSIGETLPPPACPEPTNLVVTNITPISADLSWSVEPNASSGYIWYVFDQGANPLTDPAVSTGTTPAGTTTATATGLAGGFSYDFYVVADCNADGLSQLAGPVNFATPPACGGKFYDTGGPGGDYENDANVTTVISPATAGDQVTVTFTAFDVEATWDALYVYDGPDASFPIISSGNPATNSGFPAGGYYGTTNPGPFTSTDASGALTFVFRSDASVPKAGWEADVTCSLSPPPNDLIVNSIDVDEIGFPYTDPAVHMPAATTEGGNPAGCDLTGANGVWYNFVAGGDGTANAMIVTPGGASSVTFYTAPNENAVETDLTLVVQQTNQCAPGTSASIFTLAGQAYYVFVLNTGAITDIVIDGTNLGVSDNTIAGFSYYPNPTNGILNLKSVDNIDNVSLYNILGQLVIDNRVNATTSQVDMSGLSTGTYLMRVSVNGEIGTYRVLKQ